MVDWVHDEDGDEANGIWRFLVFLSFATLSVIVKNYFVLYAKLVAVNVNKCVGAVLYNKVLKMSQKSLAVTSTGKLVSLVSGELQTIEKIFWYVPSLISTLFAIVALFTYIAVFYAEASAIAFGILLSMIIAFLSFVSCSLRYNYMASTYSDQRINYITDIINGIKTVKAYCWEHVFENKVRKARDMQLSYVRKDHTYII